MDTSGNREVLMTESLTSKQPTREIKETVTCPRGAFFSPSSFPLRWPASKNSHSGFWATQFGHDHTKEGGIPRFAAADHTRPLVWIPHLDLKHTSSRHRLVTARRHKQHRPAATHTPADTLRPSSGHVKGLNIRRRDSPHRRTCTESYISPHRAVSVTAAFAFELTLSPLTCVTSQSCGFAAVNLTEKQTPQPLYLCHFSLPVNTELKVHMLH